MRLKEGKRSKAKKNIDNLHVTFDNSNMIKGIW